MKLHAGLLGLTAVLGATAFLAAQPAPPPQGQPPTFRSEVEYVDVDVIVTDEQGRLVRGLTRDDFQVSEDGRPQPIAAFSFVDIPVARPNPPPLAAGPIEADVESNERPFHGRIYVAVLDNLHTDARRSQNVRQAARRFIEGYLGENDLMAVVQTGGRVDASQEFTANKRLLLRAVDSFVGRKLPSATVVRSEEFFRSQGAAGGGGAEPFDAERAANARTSLNVLRDVSHWLGGIRGRRKTLLFFSEGIDYDITDIIRDPMTTGGSATSVMADIREAILATARANVSIYGIDPRGLNAGGDDLVGVAALPGSLPAAPGATDQRSAGDVTSVGSLINETLRANQNLRALSEESGGFALVNANNFEPAFARVVEDNSSYYVLGYYPPSVRRDGRFHRIDVKVTRPGLTVRARRGYAAPRGDRPAPLDAGRANVPKPVLEALGSPLPATGVTMKMFAAPFKDTAKSASVLVGVELEGRDLTLASGGRIEVSYLALDAKGKMIDGKTETLSLNLRPETGERIRQGWLRVFGRLALPPGRYQLRTGALDPAGAVGSVIAYVDVPDYFAEPLAMSGLVLTSLAGSATLTVRPDEQLKGLLPAPPIALRTFAQNDEIALFAEVYDNRGDTPHTVDVTVTVAADGGAMVYSHQEERASSELRGKSGGYGISARIPAADLPVGRHVLTVEARSRLAPEHAVRRQLEIAIVPAARRPPAQ